MFEIKLHLFLSIIFVNLFSSVNCKIPRTVLCADPQCRTPISVAQANINYVPPQENVMGFKKGTEMQIMSKTKEQDGYWFAVIGSNSGFVPPTLIREKKVMVPMDSLKYEVEIDGEPVPTKSDSLNNENSNVSKPESEVEKPENQNTDTPQPSIQSSVKSIVYGEIREMPGESLTDTKNPQLKNSQQMPTKPVVEHVESSLQVNTVTEIPNSFETNTDEKSETEKKTVEDSQSPTTSQINSSYKANVPTSSEIIENNISSESSSVSNLDNQLEESVGQDQVNLGVQSSTEPKILKNELIVNQSLYEKNQEGNVNENTDNIGLVAKDEKTQNIDISNNLNTTDVNVKQESNDTVKNMQNSDVVMGSLNEAPGAAVQAPAVKNVPSTVSGMESPMRTDNKPSIGVQDHGSSWGKIMPNQIGGGGAGGNVQTESKPDAGTVANDNSLKLEMNVSVNESLAHENAVDVSASVSSSSSSSSSYGRDSNSAPSVKVTHVEPTDMRQSDTPLRGFHEGNIPETLNAPSAQFGHASHREMIQNDLHSPHKPDPSLPISSGYASYNDINLRENFKAEAAMNVNNDIKQNQHIVAPTGQPYTVDNLKSVEGSEHESRDSPYGNLWDLRQPTEGVEGTATEASRTGKISEPNELERQEIVNVAQEDTKSDFPTATTQRGDVIDVGEEHSNGDFEKSEETDPSTTVNHSVEVEQKENVDMEHIMGGNFHHEFPIDSSAEVTTDVPDASENPSGGSDFELTTPVPPPIPATDSYHSTEQNEDGREAKIAETASEEGLFSNLGETLLGWVGLGSKKEPPLEEGNHFVEELISEPQPSPEFYTEGNVAAPDETCKASDGSTTNCNESSPDESNSLWSFWLDNKIVTPPSSYNTFIYLVVTAVTVLFFTLGYYFIEKFRSDGSLIAKVNRLEQELLVSSKECLIIKDELANTKEKLNLFETSSNDEIITALQQELEESKKAKAELENNIEVLQQELDAATEAGLDLNRMLSEVLTQKGGSETLMESVEHLQAQLNSQQKIIDEMTSKLFAKTNENQELQCELTAANEKIESLEGEMEEMRGNLNVHMKENEDVIEELKAKNGELQLKIGQMNEGREKEIGKMKKNFSDLERKLKASMDSLKIKEEECNNLKDSMKKLKVKDGRNIDSLFESSKTKAELSQATSENTSLKGRLKAEEENVSRLEMRVKKLEEEIEKQRQVSSEAEKEKSEAQTRLEVLSNYFKEKETQLQKELGLREAMWVQKQGDDSTIYEKIKSLEEDISNYKSQNEALKKEILDQERGLKAQIATLEKKAHENWIAARQAERKLEETKQEAAQLRNKMTLMEKNASNDLESSQHHRVSDELNGGDALSPLMHDASSPILFPPPLPLDPNSSSLMPPGFIPPPMFMPPPPGGFMPHPPPFLPGDHRPPPLGRMSSPPLNNRFSPPPPPEYSYERMSTPPLSPSGRNYRSPNESDRERDRFRHRTPTSPSFRSRNWEESPAGFRPIASERDPRREHKGGSNLSSGHSSDSLDKSSRHSSRV